LARAKWLEKRRTELLPVEYFHVVFTLPEPLAALALQNKQQMYGMLFQATAETLQQIAADPKHLGAQIGFFCILHTWGQTLTVHPHLHCVVPAAESLRTASIGSPASWIPFAGSCTFPSLSHPVFAPLGASLRQRQAAVSWGIAALV
jgi:hypothetical protein